jgi:hypothetical protein
MGLPQLFGAILLLNISQKTKSETWGGKVMRGISRLDK